MSTRLRALAELSLNGVTYAPGDIVVLPPGQDARAAGLLRYGLVEQAPAPPVKSRRRRTP